ncbi:MAG: hypothetical protein E6614_25025 [Bradyrhizobium sp.]|uniref:Uncharacterized protein n=2 Tax=Bradyrhizobium TaxID=374 RepID=A0ABR7UKI4_9BRAD|nr:MULTISPECIES: hypothetical protein [Bradyrhizobium]MBC9879985.1 hypothetical protein [Bradyrhizobium campsiandrae]MBC9984120.1 hypothetical protein [Bradyrhizobium campsiandrae]MBR1090532.1 hypothetical protein [Bradyrhizobium manausense]MDU1497711.1 hypothetical protein [Bradyrhizobium sp.]MDU1547994.1 hypothetical protein [Bradyrhizobium sp.]
MATDDGNVVPFDYIYRGERHQCGYRIVGDKLVVVVGEKERIAERGRMMPDRLARVLVHELLVEAEFARRARETSNRPDAPPC